MESAKEKSFYDALGAVPDVPSGVIERVERRVRQSGVKRRAMLAACLLLAFIIPALLLHQSNTSVAYAEDCESMDELFYALQFLSGDLDDDYLFDVGAEISAGGGANGGTDSGSALSLSTSDKKPQKKLSVKERSDEN
jgi:hypothetical protein